MVAVILHPVKASNLAMRSSAMQQLVEVAWIFGRPGYSSITCASNGLPYPGVRNVCGGVLGLLCVFLVIVERWQLRQLKLKFLENLAGNNPAEPGGRLGIILVAAASKRRSRCPDKPVLQCLRSSKALQV